MPLLPSVLSDVDEGNISGEIVTNLKKEQYMPKGKMTMTELKKLTRNKSFVPQTSDLKQGDKEDDAKHLIRFQ